MENIIISYFYRLKLPILSKITIAMFVFPVKILYLGIFLTIISENSQGQFIKIGPGVRRKREVEPIGEKILCSMAITDSLSDIKGKGSLPLKKIEITSFFGERLHPVDHIFSFHGGLDLKACYEPVFAFGNGRVNRAGWDERAGYYIVLGHGTGKLESIYAHLLCIGVRVGQPVESGQIIGLSGNSGLSTGPHLHFGLKYAGKEIDPVAVLRLVVQQQIQENEFQSIIQYPGTR